MTKQYTLKHKLLVVGIFMSLGLAVNDQALAEYYDGYYQNGQWVTQQTRSAWVDNAAQGQGNVWGKGAAQGQASADAEGEVELVIKLRAKMRTDAEMQQSRQFEGFMSQMRQMNQQMFQQRNFSNQMQNSYYQQPNAYSYPVNYPVAPANSAPARDY